MPVSCCVRRSYSSDDFSCGEGHVDVSFSEKFTHEPVSTGADELALITFDRIFNFSTKNFVK